MIAGDKATTELEVARQRHPAHLAALARAGRRGAGRHAAGLPGGARRGIPAPRRAPRLGDRRVGCRSGRSSARDRGAASPRARRAAGGGQPAGAARGGGAGRRLAHAGRQRPRRAHSRARRRPRRGRPAVGRSRSRAARAAPRTAELPALATRRCPLSGIRRVTAERMALSARTVAPVTLTTEANATALVRLREQAAGRQRRRADERAGVTDLLIKLVGVALGEHPALNAELTETASSSMPRSTSRSPSTRRRVCLHRSSNACSEPLRRVHRPRIQRG